MTRSNELVPMSRSQIPIANMRHVFRIGDVEKRLDKLPASEHESLRATYERMLEKGPERFQVKPSGLPAMEHLYDELPNFTEVLDDLKRQLALCSDSRDEGPCTASAPSARPLSSRTGTAAPTMPTVYSSSLSA